MEFRPSGVILVFFGIAEVYNNQRLNDINQTNLKTVVTHTGIDVGADGKTHQCIDYIFNQKPFWL